MTRKQPPPTSELTYEQYSGRSCVWCGKPLWRGAVSAGISCGRIGAHVQDIEVYRHPRCSSNSATRTQMGKT